ncbi:MAG: tRNA epoxyqueuosine(34) reductase QueG, partial [Planctomycetota bacterium]
PEHRFRAFTDTAPVAERELAARAGIGWTGRHTLAINPELGSWFVLGGILTTLELTPPSEQRVVPDHCGTCTRCVDACPTDAITPYSVDASRCISYLTIEHRSPIDPELFGAIGDWIAGCDICQEVCPHNSPRPKGDVGSRHAAYEPVRLGFDLKEVARWSAEDRAEAVRGSALKRIKLDMFRRNALIAIGNAFRERGDQAMLDVIEAATADESELVRQTARDLLADLGRPPASPAG